MTITGNMMARWIMSLSIVGGVVYVVLGFVGVIKDVDYLMASLFLSSQSAVLLSMGKKDDKK